MNEEEEGVVVEPQAILDRKGIISGLSALDSAAGEMDTERPQPHDMGVPAGVTRSVPMSYRATLNS